MRLIAGLAMLVMLAGPAGPADAQAIPTIPPPKPTDVSVLVSSFNGDAAVGENVARVLKLQIQRTLRRRPTPNPMGLDFGTGRVVQVDAKAAESLEGIEEFTKGLQAQMIVWGMTDTYPDGVVVRAALVAPDYADGRARHAETWTLSFKGQDLVLPFQPRVFLFSPVVLDPAMVERYGRADALQVCSAPVVGCTGPALSGVFQALEQDGDWSQIGLLGGAKGWIYLADLRLASNDVANFSSGIAAYFRSDYVQAARRMAQIVASEDASSDMKRDAAVIWLSALARSGADIAQDGARLLADHPWSLEGRKALAMAILAQAIDQPEHRRALLNSARAYVESAEGQLDTPDDWSRAADALLVSLAS